MNKFGLATILEKVPVGYEFYENNIPLHLTHIDSFQIDLDAENLELKLRRHLIGQKVISTTIKGLANYGPNKDISVVEIDLNDNLKSFHSNLLTFLEAEGAVFKRPQFLGKNFKPHITETSQIKLFKNEIVNIVEISIAYKEPIDIKPITKILSTIAFTS